MIFTQEEKDFLIAFIPGHKEKEIAEAFNKRFNKQITTQRVHSFKSNNKIRSGTTNGLKTGSYSVWTKEIREFFYEYNPGHIATEMQQALFEKFGKKFTIGQITAFRKNHNLKCGVCTKYKKGNIPANTGKHGLAPEAFYRNTWRKGHVTWNKAVVGAETVTTDGYVKVKIAQPNVWAFKHTLIWEKENGKVPEGFIVVFKDGNKLNCTIENLDLISRAENAVINRCGLRASGLYSTAKVVAQLQIKVAKLKRREQK